ncbi:MAG: cell division protein FtsK [Nocardiopsaceae bacterium]|nr:cell division protein FtsK [Nocardiopsaceae bacterium]
MNDRPNRRQLRRHARRLHHDGFQPMMVLNSGDQLPETPATAIVRAIWRYRSELAPIAVAIVTAITAATLHHAHEGAWPWLAIATVATTALLAAPPPAWAKKAWPILDRPAERIYAATATTAIGGWLTAATAIGPATAPMPIVAVALTATTGIPWWASHRRRSKVRVDRLLESWPDIAHAVGLTGSQVMSALVDVWGWRARLRLARGQTINDVMTKLPAIESGIGTFRGAVRVYPTPDDLANRCELRVLDIDPHADAIDWPGPSTTTINEPIDLGPFEDAAPCRVRFLRRHVLFGGATGAGKSGGLNVLMGNLAACEDVVIWGIDLKKGMELGPWAPCIDRLATTPDEARSLLQGAVNILEARAALLAERGQRTWEPSPDMPALVIVIDEYAELADDAPEAIKHADSIARRGRAVAVNLVAATQRPTQKAMGHGAVRSQMDVRISFRVRERKDVDLILGQGMLNAGWHAHTLNAPGKFLIASAEHDTPKRARAYLITDQAVADTAARFAEFRPPLDTTSIQAITQDHSSERIVATPEAPRVSVDDAGTSPDGLLWAALSFAPEEGATVPDLMTATRMSRPWIYLRLRDLAAQRQVTQVSRGRWRAISDNVP